jgi:hypothetical protein
MAPLKSSRVQPQADDDTVRIIPPVRPRPRHRLWFAAAGLVVAGVIVAVIALWPRPAPLPVAGESTIFRHVSRHFAVFRFADDRLVLVFDCPDLHAQGLMFDRIAALIEKADAPKDRVLSTTAFHAALVAADLTIGTYYYGDDYPARALRKFFRLAQAEHRHLNPLEQRLHEIGAAAGFLKPGAAGAVISIPQAGAGHRVGLRARAVILRHELSHGAYFTIPAYRAFVHHFYNTALTASEQAAFKNFLVRQGYDGDEHGLIVNETLAYLVFTRDKEFFRAEVVGMSDARVAMLRAEFIAMRPDIWLNPCATAPLPGG